MSGALHAGVGPWQSLAVEGGWVSMRVERRLHGTRWVVVAHAMPLGRERGGRVLYDGTDPRAATAVWRAYAGGDARQVG